MQKFIKRYTDEDPELFILWQLIRFADHNRKFNRDFLDKVYEYYEKYDHITEKQYLALKKIYNEFKVFKTFPIDSDD